jgi:putative sterol carrier protein
VTLDRGSDRPCHFAAGETCEIRASTTLNTRTETTMVEWNISSPANLAEAIDGRSDAEIDKALEGKYEQVCTQVADAMKDRFVPEKAAGDAAVIQYDIAAPDGVHTFQLKVASGQCEVTKGAPGPARVTLALTLPNFLRLVSGKLDGMQAFLGGKLKVSGDLMFAQTMQRWFRQT